MSTLVDSNQKEFNKIVDFLDKEIGSLRGARASSSLVENILIEVYSSKMILKEVAGIHLEGHKSIVIEPWDKNNLKPIEKAISESSLNVVPMVDGQIIRINFPPLNEEKRKDIIRILHQKAEHARVGLRGVRDKIKDNIFQQEKSGEIGEDEKFRLMKELDEKIGNYNDIIKEKVEKKEKELMEI